MSQLSSQTTEEFTISIRTSSGRQRPSRYLHQARESLLTSSRQVNDKCRSVGVFKAKDRCCTVYVVILVRHIEDVSWGVLSSCGSLGDETQLKGWWNIAHNKCDNQTDLLVASHSDLLNVPCKGQTTLLDHVQNQTWTQTVPSQHPPQGAWLLPCCSALQHGCTLHWRLRPDDLFHHRETAETDIYSKFPSKIWVLRHFITQKSFERLEQLQNLMLIIKSFTSRAIIFIMRLRWCSFFTFSWKNSENRCFDTRRMLWRLAMLVGPQKKTELVVFKNVQCRDRNSLFKQREVDQKLWDVDNVLQAEMVLTSEERVRTFGPKGHVEHLVTEWQRVWRLQTFPFEEDATAES